MALSTPVYLDYAATTPVDPSVAEAMAKCLTLDGNFGNPASRSYRFGWLIATLEKLFLLRGPLNRTILL